MYTLKRYSFLGALAVLSFLSLQPLVAVAVDEITEGFVYGKEPPTLDPIYRFERRVLKGLNGDHTVVSRYIDIDSGKEAVFESVEYKGGEMRRYVFKQRQISEEGALDVQEGKALFSTKNQEKDKPIGTFKIETDSEDMKDNTVVIDEMVNLLRAKWSDMMKGEDLEIRLAIVSRRETVGFKIFKDKEIDYHGKAAVRMKMKPQSFFIALFVNPLYLIFEAGGDHRILEVDGRMPLKKFHDGDFSDIEGVLKFKYD